MAKNTFNLRTSIILLSLPFTSASSYLFHCLMHLLKPSIFKIESHADLFLKSSLLTLVVMLIIAYICKFSFLPKKPWITKFKLSDRSSITNYYLAKQTWLKALITRTYQENFLVFLTNKLRAEDIDLNPIGSLLLGGAVFTLLFLYFHMALTTSIVLACIPLFLQIISHIPGLRQVPNILAVFYTLSALFVSPLILHYAIFPGVNYGTLLAYQMLAIFIFILASTLILAMISIPVVVHKVEQAKNNKITDNDINTFLNKEELYEPDVDLTKIYRLPPLD